MAGLLPIQTLPSHSGRNIQCGQLAIQISRVVSPWNLATCIGVGTVETISLHICMKNLHYQIACEIHIYESGAVFLIRTSKGEIVRSTALCLNGPWKMERDLRVNFAIFQKS